VSDERGHLSLSHAYCEPIWDSTTAASYLQIHPRTLIRMARSGEIPAFQIGTHWRFRRSDLDEWMGSKVSSHSKLNGPVRVN
jgi:excisionase family DNA binding protein